MTVSIITVRHTVTYRRWCISHCDLLP